MERVVNNGNKHNKKPFFSAFVISANIFLSRVAGLVRDICFARFLGTGIVAEAFYVAFRLPNTFRRIFADGAMSNVFVPFFSTKAKDDKARARIFAGHVMTLLTIALTVLTIVMEIFMPTVVRLINPGFVNDAEKFNLAVNLSRIAFPYKRDSAQSPRNVPAIRATPPNPAAKSIVPYVNFISFFFSPCV